MTQRSWLICSTTIIKMLDHTSMLADDDDEERNEEWEENEFGICTFFPNEILSS